LTLLVIEWDGAPAARLSLQLDSRLDDVRRGAARLREFWTEAGVPAADQDALELCFVEAGNNSVIHAYGGQQGIEILVDSSVGEDAVEVVVRDHGAPMPQHALDPREAREGTPVAELPEGGRGGLLLRSLADEVRIDTGPDGNVVAFRKLRKPSSPPA
jgi:serine/threonine-protein kinase RsbW